MTINTTGFLEAPDSGSGGGSFDAGSTNNASSGVMDTGGLDSSPESTPQALELADDTLIRIKGSDKPVKFSDHVKGFQAQWTKASQRAAQLERALREKEALLREHQQRQQAAQQSQPQASNEDVYAALRQLPYLTGEDAVGVVESIGQQLRQRDMVLMGTLREMQAMRQILNGLHETHTNQSFEGKIKGFLEAGGYGPEYTNLAKEIYLAYEGDDLDQEFPQIFASRIEEIERLIEAKRQAKINQNRRQPFIPGKGGQTGPSKPLQLKANASSKEIADQVWASMQGSDT